MMGCHDHWDNTVDHERAQRNIEKEEKIIDSLRKWIRKGKSGEFSVRASRDRSSLSTDDLDYSVYLNEPEFTIMYLGKERP